LKLVLVPDGRYRVITVKNSTAFNPGQVLCREEVNVLCNKSEWEVIIVGSNSEMEKTQ
jgi:hypothetical protein